MYVTAEASVNIARSTVEVFDFVTAHERIPQLLLPLGPIPGVVSMERVAGDADAPGVHRRVALSDRTEVTEEVLVFDRGVRHLYRWTKPPAFPLSLLVSGAESEWLFRQEAAGTRLTWRYTFRLTSPLAWPAVMVLRALFARWMGAGLGRARRALEGSA